MGLSILSILTLTPPFTFEAPVVEPETPEAIEGTVIVCPTYKAAPTVTETIGGKSSVN